MGKLSQDEDGFEWSKGGFNIKDLVGPLLFDSK